MGRNSKRGGKILSDCWECNQYRGSRRLIEPITGGKIVQISCYVGGERLFNKKGEEV